MTQVETSSDKIPSNCLELLKNIRDSKILRMTRYSSYEAQEAAEEIEEMYAAAPTSVFRRTIGALVISFSSGLTLGFSSIDSIASVTMWEAEHSEFEEDEEDEFFPIDACDQNYSEKKVCQLVGNQVIEVSLLKREPQSALYVGLPCEAGLVLKFEDGLELIMSHKLSDNMDNFSIIFRDEIPSEILEAIQEHTLI
jgi:hypothetical protein